jgi:hypothetical protein
MVMKMTKVMCENEEARSREFSDWNILTKKFLGTRARLQGKDCYWPLGVKY